MPLVKSIFGIYHPTHKIALLLGDLILLAIAFYVASHARLKSEPDFYSVEYVGISVIIVACLFLGGAYTSSSISRRPKLPLNTFFIVIASAFPSLLFIYILGPDHFTALLGRGVFPFAIISFGGLSVINRFVLNYVFHEPNLRRTVLLLGPTKLNDRLSRSLSESKINILVTHSNELCSSKHKRTDLNAIVVLPDYSPTEHQQQTLLEYRLAGIPIYSLSDFFESFLFLIPVQEIDNNWFIRSQGFTMLHSSVVIRVKRAVDITGALALLVISLPIMAVAIVIIRATSKGSAVFSQTRVGLHGEPFTIYKFRTMYPNSEPEGAQWANNNDDRIIPFGRFLRTTRIDELPQVWNILRGDMSIVGPRPERPEFTTSLAEDIPYYDLRHVVKPGLTGWAQVSYPYGASTEDALRKLQYELYQSLLLDLNIMLRTLITVFQRAGR